MTNTSSPPGSASPASDPARPDNGITLENAGAIDLGDGWCAVFKMESHNHPSAIEPYEGAATGVGGILRDIFAMGMRPIALLDSLRFGPLSIPPPISTSCGRAPRFTVSIRRRPSPIR